VKNSVAPLPFQLPLCRNHRSVASRIESYFCRSSIAGQPISVLVIIQTASTERRFQLLMRNGNGRYILATKRNYGNGTTEGQNGTAKRQRQHGNGMVETRHYAELQIGHFRFRFG